MGRVPSLSNSDCRLSFTLPQQAFDLRQFPGTQQTDRIGAEALPGVERPFATVRAQTISAVMQALAVEVQLQAPAFNVDRNLIRSRVHHPQGTHAQRGIAQALAHFAAGQFARHPRLHWQKLRASIKRVPTVVSDDWPTPVHLRNIRNPLFPRRSFAPMHAAAPVGHSVR